MARRRETDWLKAERVVRLLEDAIERHGLNAKVEHDVQLPDLLTGDLRQCDVVIRATTPEGEVLTIVEVQHRSTAVKILTFQGWCEKKRVLGADYLLCVAKKKYPQSIQRDAAMRRGPSVKLLTLAELEEDQWPIQIINNEFSLFMEVRTPTMKPAVFRCAGQYTPPVVGRQSAKVFRREGNKQLLSIGDLVEFEREKSDVNFGDGTTVEQEWAIPMDPPLYFIDKNGSRRRVTSMIVPVRFRKDELSLPVRVLSYEQIGQDDPLAWAVSGKAKYKGKSITLTAIIVSNLDGTFTMRRAECSGIPNVKGFKMSVY